MSLTIATRARMAVCMMLLVAENTYSEPSGAAATKHTTSHVAPTVRALAKEGGVMVTEDQNVPWSWSQRQWNHPIRDQDWFAMNSQAFTAEGWAQRHSQWAQLSYCPGDQHGSRTYSVVEQQVCVETQTEHGVVWLNLDGNPCSQAKCINPIQGTMYTAADLPPHRDRSAGCRGTPADVMGYGYIAGAKSAVRGMHPGLTETYQRLNASLTSGTGPGGVDLAHHTTVCEASRAPGSWIQNPVTGYTYPSATLRVTGMVTTRRAEGQRGGDNDNVDDGEDNEACVGVPGAIVEVWQVDEFGRMDGGEPTPLAEAHARHGTLPNGESSSLEPGAGHCRGVIVTDTDGSYSFETVFPGAYGPPQMIHFRVTAPGLKELFTTMYFEDDPWFRHKLRHNLDALLKDPRVVSTRTGTLTGTGYGSNAPGSSFHARFDMTLDPATTHATASAVVGRNGNGVFANTYHGAPISDYELNGLWSDDLGDILVEALGTHVLMTEVPRPRRFQDGVESGLLVGETIREVSTTSSGQEGVAVGTLVPRDLHGNGDARIEWYSVTDGKHWTWTKVRAPLRFRFLRLTVTETLRQGFDNTRAEGTTASPEPAGHVNINELSFFEGVLHRNEHPPTHLKFTQHASPQPRAFSVQCSSEESSSTPCWKAFDGDRSQTNRWRSSDVGRLRRPSDGRSTAAVLERAQWVEVDFGEATPENWILPTAMKIVCDPGDAGNSFSGYRDCPKAFHLEGSTDGHTYTRLYAAEWLTYRDYLPANPVEDSHALYDHNASVRGNDGVFEFTYLPTEGRSEGDRCGSCDTAPHFGCAFDDHDHTCGSRYCGVDGRCAPRSEMLCGLGMYLRHSDEATDESYSCELCPAGRFGDSPSLRSHECSGLCDAGYFCPPGSTSPRQHLCGGADVFCPEGSEAPLPVSKGYFSEVKRSARVLWPHITHQSVLDTAAASASISRSATRDEGETSVTVHDPEHWKHVRTDQRLCPPGYFCENGEIQVCGEGVYGAREGLASPQCSGKCLASTYCPPGSVTPLRCPPGFYCPDGFKRWPCPAGTYGNTTGLASPSCTASCEPGHYCVTGSAAMTECPPGVYGDVKGLTSPDCTAPCPAGHFCPIGTVEGRGNKCGGAHVFCPRGVEAPIPVSTGFYTTHGDLERRESQTLCESGYFCVRGIRHICRAGTFGNESGLDFPTAESSFCNGLCDFGHYCLEGSTDRRQHACPAGTYGGIMGNTNSECSGLCAPGHYCEAGSTSPSSVLTQVTAEYDDSNTVLNASYPCGEGVGPSHCQPAKQCPAGSFGNTTGLTSAACSSTCVDLNDHRPGGDGSHHHPTKCVPSVCQEGYFCPPGSIAPRQRECGGAHVFCPAGSGEPTPARPGFYTVGRGTSQTRAHEVECEQGHYCMNGVKRECPAGTYGATDGLASPKCSGLCAPGHYCPQASTSATERRCPLGRYGAVSGLKSVGCSGVCEAGYYCPEASTSSTQVKCGGDGVYCPRGSGSPVVVKPGHFTVGGHNSTVRSAQAMCVAGSYCSGGVKFDCPAGTFGSRDRLTSARCSGLCERGFYCPPGSTSPTERVCPFGRYGSTRGLKTSACSGACARNYECPPGSVDQHGMSVVSGQV